MNALIIDVLEMYVFRKEKQAPLKWLLKDKNDSDQR